MLQQSRKEWKILSKALSTFSFECTGCQFCQEDGERRSENGFLEAHGSNGDDGGGANEKLAGHLNSLNGVDTPVGVVPNLSREARREVG